MRTFANINPVLKGLSMSREDILARATAARAGAMADVDAPILAVRFLHWFIIHSITSPIHSYPLFPHAFIQRSLIYSFIDIRISREFGDFAVDDLVWAWWGGEWYEAQVRAKNPRTKTISIRFHETDYNVAGYHPSQLAHEHPEADGPSDVDE